MDSLGALIEEIAPPAREAGPAEAGSLSGLRFVAKDVLDVEGAITGAGNPDWAAARAPASAHAAAVAALLGAGAELVGKGHCAELAFSLSGDNVHYGMPSNSADPDRDPGGSTSGPAAAVAGGLCELGLGTDTLGSVRVPASYCGLYGYRPTHGVISVAGALPLAQRFDTIGVLARAPAALRAAAEALSGPNGGGDDPPRTLLVLAEGLGAAEPEIAETTRAAAGRLGNDLGAKVQEAALPAGAPALADCLAAFGVLQGAEVWRNFGPWIEAARPTFGPDVAARLERAARFGRPDTERAEPVATAAATFVRRLGADEALVVPAAGTVAPPRDADRGVRERARVAAGSLTCLASLAGAPAVSLPLARAGGAPVGISLVGPPGADRALLAAAVRGAPGPP